MADRIKMVREKFHMNRTEFAASIGITSSLVSQMELGKVNVSWKTSHLLEDKFGISQKWLHFGEGAMFIREDITVESILEQYPEIKKLYDARVDRKKAAEDRIWNRAVRIEKRDAMRREAADRLKKIRDAYQINQNQLAKRLGYTRAYISAVEKGIQKPSLRMAEMIEAEFGVSATWLLYGTAA